MFFSCAARNQVRAGGAFRPGQAHYSTIQHADTVETDFAIGRAVIFFGQERRIENMLRLRQIDAVLLKILAPLASS
jgi:hypothetical protein